jgi:hypothetical protein
MTLLNVTRGLFVVYKEGIYWNRVLSPRVCLRGLVLDKDGSNLVTMVGHGGADAETGYETQTWKKSTPLALAPSPARQTLC